MPMPTKIHACIAALLSVTMIPGCGSGESDRFEVVVVGNPDDPFESGVRLSLAGQLARASTQEGLVAFDAEGRVVPALADRWIVTDDGSSYIFRLRDGTWKDGSEITSKSAIAALRRVIAALKGTSLGLDLNGIEEIRGMAGRVVEIRLNHPMPHFLQILAQPELGLLHGGEGAGPMRLDRVGETAVLTPIKPEELGMPKLGNWQDRARDIHLSALPGAEAVERFNADTADLVLGGRIADFPYTASVGILRGTIQPDAVIGLFGLRATNLKGFLSEPANREVIAMAIDRAALIESFNLGGWLPSTRIVAPDLEGDLGTIGERWSEMTLDERRAVASGRVSRWRQGAGSGAPPKLRLWLPEGPGGDILYNGLSGDLRAVGIETERATEPGKADLRLIDTVARYPSAEWFLNRLSCKARTGACESKADKRVAESAKQTNAAERAALLAEAEAELTQANVFIPFGPPIRWSLVRGDVQGYATNRWGWHPLMPMALLPK